MHTEFALSYLSPRLFSCKQGVPAETALPGFGFHSERNRKSDKILLESQICSLLKIIVTQSLFHCKMNLMLYTPGNSF